MALKDELIKLGYEQPALRDKLRPILAALETKTASNWYEAEQTRTAAHYNDGGDWYADTKFINEIQRVYPDSKLKHMGFGEFYLETPDGRLDFDRMRGKDFPGQSGRSHKMTDDAGGKVVEKAVRLMERA